MSSLRRPLFLPFRQKRPHKLQKNPWAPAGGPGTPEGKKMTEKGSFAGTPAGCSRDAQLSKGFSETLCDRLCAFLFPVLETVENIEKVLGWDIPWTSGRISEWKC